MTQMDIKQIGAHVQAASAPFRALTEQVGRVIVGQAEMVRQMLIGILANGHILLEGVPGLAKTTAVACLARGINTGFRRLQFTPDLLPADLIGTMIYQPQSGQFTVKKGPIFSNIILADEINRAPAKVQSALLEAMQERQVSVEGTTHRLPDPFLVVATQNPVEFEGTFALPQAQLDRFLLRASVGYPDDLGERRIARRHQDAADPLDELMPVIPRDGLLALRDLVRTVRVADDVEAYVVAIVRATRSHPDVELGASPRASVALYRSAQAGAVLAGRDFVTPDDIKAVAPAVLAHRLVVNLDRSLHGATAESALAAVLATTPAPPLAGD